MPDTAPPASIKPSTRGLDIRQHRLGMARQVELVAFDVIGLGNLSIGTDQVADASWDAGFEILLAGLANSIVGRPHRFVGIRQECIGKAFALSERLLIAHRIERSTQNDTVGAFERLAMITEPVTLNRSTRCRSLGVPP